MGQLDPRSLSPDKLRKIRAIGWLVGNLEAADRVASLQTTSPVPRDKLAASIRKFVCAYDEARIWRELDQGDDIRRRALTLADTLEEQHRRTVGAAAGPLIVGGK